MKNFLDEISPNDALQVLRKLCDVDPDLRQRIQCEALKLLSNGDADKIADEVYCELDGIDVEELWDRSGPSRHGYSSPEEMAVEMLEELLQRYIDRVKKYHEIGMAQQSREYCMGVLQGIYEFDHRSKSQFKEWAMDVPSECFGALLSDWRRGCSQKDDLVKMNKFISKNCPEWARWAVKS